MENEENEITLQLLEKESKFIPITGKEVEKPSIEDIMQPLRSIDDIENDIQPAEEEYSEIPNVETPNTSSRKYNRMILTMTMSGIVIALIVIYVTIVYFAK